MILYAAVPDSEPATSCTRILGGVLAGELDGRTSTAVIEEVLHVQLTTTHLDLAGVAAVAYSILTPLLPVTDEAIRIALDLAAPRLGSNDRVHVGTCRVHDIDTILTGDRGFDGIEGLRRIDPLDADAVAALLA